MVFRFRESTLHSPTPGVSKLIWEVHFLSRLKPYLKILIFFSSKDLLRQVNVSILVCFENEYFGDVFILDCIGWMFPKISGIS